MEFNDIFFNLLGNGDSVYQDFKKKVKSSKVDQIRFEYRDINGIPKSQDVKAENLDDLVKFGEGFDGSSIPGIVDITESDRFLVPDVNTFSVLPWTEDSSRYKTARVISDIYSPNGAGIEQFKGDPRFVLKRNLKKISEQGYEFKAGAEMEFYLFKRNEDGNWVPHDNGGYHDSEPLDQGAWFRDKVAERAEQMGIDVEARHHEVGPGQHEMGIKYGNALDLADNIFTFRQVVKNTADENGLWATFVPKPIVNENGNGMHIHQSFFDKNGNNLFHGNGEDGLSNEAYGFVKEQLDNSHAMAAVLNPLPYSYERLKPGYEAPTVPAHGLANRTVATRIPANKNPSNKKAKTVEYRPTDPSTNPYLALAVMASVGVDGITSPNDGTTYRTNESLYDDQIRDDFKDKFGVSELPSGLEEALGYLEGNKKVNSVLGEAYQNFVDAKKKDIQYVKSNRGQKEMKNIDTNPYFLNY